MEIADDTSKRGIEKNGLVIVDEQWQQWVCGYWLFRDYYMPMVFTFLQEKTICLTCCRNIKTSAILHGE